MEYSMCYLDKVYTDNNDAVKLYQLILCDNTFHNIADAVVDIDGLKKYLDNPALVKDFDIDNGFLKCDSKIRLRSTSNIENLCNQIIPYEIEESTFFNFIDVAIKNNYIVVSDDIVDVDDYKGLSFTSFYNIKFSQSTMSVYFTLCGSDNKIYNKMLITLKDGILISHSFKFGVPAGKEVYPGCVLIKQMSINNELYDVYDSGVLAHFPSSFCVSSSLLNKAVTCSAIYKNIIATVKDYIKIVSSTLQLQEDSDVNWGGGSGSYESEYGITFKSSLQDLKSSEREYFINKLFKDYLSTYSSFDEARSACNQAPNYSFLGATVMNTLLFISYSSSGASESINTAKAVRNKFMLDKMNVDLFLYKTRVGCYLHKIQLVDKLYPILEGSEYKEQTIVQAGYYYGDEF